MTISIEPPGLWFAVCDTCGDRIELDTDPDDPITEAVAEIKQKGWRCHPPSTVYIIPHCNLRITYWTHTCKDCR